MSHIDSQPTPDQAQKPVVYLSYLVRLWRATQTAPAQWLASVQNPHTGERIGFENVEQLFAFLLAQMEGDPRPHERVHTVPGDGIRRDPHISDT